MWNRSTLQTRSSTTRPHYESEPQRRLRSNTNPKPQHKSKATLQIRGSATIPQPQRRLLKLERAEGAFAPIQAQSPNTSPRPQCKVKPHCKFKAFLQILNPTTSFRPQQGCVYFPEPGGGAARPARPAARPTSPDRPPARPPVRPAAPGRPKAFFKQGSTAARQQQRGSVAAWQQPSCHAATVDRSRTLQRGSVAARQQSDFGKLQRSRWNLRMFQTIRSRQL